MTAIRGRTRRRQQLPGRQRLDRPAPPGASTASEQVHAADGPRHAAATWTFANLDPDAYYDVYVTWSPEADASAAAQYVVSDGSGRSPSARPIAPINQTLAPADDQAAGVFWHDLGVFARRSRPRLPCSCRPIPSGAVLADAVRLVKYAAPPTTNLIMNSFTADSGAIFG